MQFTWLLGDEPVTSTMGATTVNVGQQTSLLIIQSVTFKHAGNYTCSATNAGGQANRTAELIVKGNVYNHFFLSCI